MKANWLPLSAAVALALSSVAASAVDFHGYFRAGAQANTQGGEVYCLGNGNKGHKVGRLGDECDTYAELTLNQEVYNKANNKWTLNTLVAYGTVEGNRDLQGNALQGVGGEMVHGMVSVYLSVNSGLVTRLMQVIRFGLVSVSTRERISTSLTFTTSTTQATVQVSKVST